MNTSIVGGIALPASPFERANFYHHYKNLWVVPLNTTTFIPAPVAGYDWRGQRLTPRELVEVFNGGRYEIGLRTGDGVIVIETPDPIVSWVHQEFGVPFSLTERFGLYQSFYNYTGAPFENSLPPPFENTIRVYSQGVVPAPGTPEPGRKTLFVRGSGASFEPWWMPELAHEVKEWRLARREAGAIHAAEARAARRAWS